MEYITFLALNHRKSPSLFLGQPLSQQLVVLIRIYFIYIIIYLFILLTLPIGHDATTVSKLTDDPKKKIAAFFGNAYPKVPFSVLSDVEFKVYISGCCKFSPFFAVPCHMTFLLLHFPFHSHLSTDFFRPLYLPLFQCKALLSSHEPSA